MGWISGIIASVTNVWVKPEGDAAGAYLNHSEFVYSDSGLANVYPGSDNQTRYAVFDTVHPAPVPAPEQLRD